jgi:PHD/YefM family antitoxin component YafN of YafNO toxin-antitoxin module
MTNLHYLFEIYDGHNVIEPIDQTQELFRKHIKHLFVDYQEMTDPIREFLTKLESDQHPVRITNGHKSLSLIVLEEYEESFKQWIPNILVIKSDLMRIATKENLEILKKLFSFWENIELVLKQLNKD